MLYCSLITCIYVFVFRALQVLLGWKLSVLMVILITTTQRLEVKSFSKHLKFNFTTRFLVLVFCYWLIMTRFIFLTSQSPAGRSQQTSPPMWLLDQNPPRRKRLRRSLPPLSRSRSQEGRRAPTGHRHLRRLNPLKKPASSPKSQRSPSG